MIKLKDIFDKLAEKLKKTGSIGLIAIVGILGLVLLLLPTEKSAAPDPLEESLMVNEVQDTLLDMEERMEEVLSEIHGVGKVKVLLSLETEGQVHLATDKKYSDRGETAGREQTENAVIVGAGGSVQNPVVIRRDYPKYRGALVVAEGAGDPVVRLALMESVKSLTGLTADCISIARMHSG